MNALGTGARIGDYVIERELPAKRGLVAYSAKHSLLPRRARISTLHPSYASVQPLAAQLTREACILEVLRHVGAPRVFECGELPDHRPWVASELIEAPDVGALLAEEGKLGLSAVLALLAGVAEILHYAHTRGLVHRSLRPAAIASRPEGPCIVDWSDAHARDTDGRGGEALQITAADQSPYQPPEVTAGEPADSRADVFALGVIAREALIGARPALGARFPLAVPPRLAALLDRMTALHPLVRPTSAEVRAESLALIEQIDLPAPSGDEEADVQIVDVELGIGLTADPEGDAPLPPEHEDLDDRVRTRTMQREVVLNPPLDPTRTHTESMPALAAELMGRAPTEAMSPELIARTRTEPMTPEHLPARTKTEEMPDPEPRVSRTSTRMAKLALPSRLLERSNTKP
jgi:serine/threonine protein kinase